jgi:hypothetical protein
MAKDEQNEVLFEEGLLKSEGPVECLGMTFENDDTRREHFLGILREKLKDPEFRKIEGFPLGEDEDILALSDPPYYTACPNPFISEFVRLYGKLYEPETDYYHREPFAVDVSVGKTDVLYRAHGYHTKVPHLAIVPSIMHYTELGDIILDGFCGSGMTGVAAQWCSCASESYRRELETTFDAEQETRPVWGLRRVILNDLAPAATAISANYNIPFDFHTFVAIAQALLNELVEELGWMYETHHTDGRLGRIDYTVWSEVFSCPECLSEVVFFDQALDRITGRVKESFTCDSCGTGLTRKTLNRRYESQFDNVLGSAIQVPSRKPVLIAYSIDGSTFEKVPDESDLALVERIGSLALPDEVPRMELPYMHMTHERSRMDISGITHVHHFFMPRAAQALAALWRKANLQEDLRLRHMLLFFVDEAIRTMSVLNRYRPTGYSQVGQYLTGVYYVPSQISELSPWYVLNGKLKALKRAFNYFEQSFDFGCISTTSSTGSLDLPNDSIDYIFTDPPFGENIYYADLNFMVEAWYRVFSDAGPEAIVDRAKHKVLLDYQELMTRCFKEYYRVLKPGRWMTVVFHNSRNSVWNAIQESLLAAGFMVADVRTLDKQQGSYRQVTSTAVKQDLVISAYEPNSGLEERFKLEAGTEEGAWDFMRTHLKQLPVFVATEGKAEVIAERQNYLLFDRMVAFHVQRGVTVPLSAGEFYAGLIQRFPERDGMFFLTEQAPEYDKKRMKVAEVVQLELFVTDESSAIQWLKQQLTRKPRTFPELHPDFMREIAGWEKHEKPLELLDLLNENFLLYDGTGDVPPQIHSYLSSNYEDLHKLEKNDPVLKDKAKGRYYVPDPNKAQDLEKLRERSLLKEFEEYGQAKTKKLKVFRVEAVRAGFKKAWQERDYDTIIDVAEKIPESVLQDDAKLLMWYDQARTRAGAG